MVKKIYQEIRRQQQDMQKSQISPKEEEVSEVKFAKPIIHRQTKKDAQETLWKQSGKETLSKNKLSRRFNIKVLDENFKQMPMQEEELKHNDEEESVRSLDLDIVKSKKLKDLEAGGNLHP